MNLQPWALQKNALATEPPRRVRWNSSGTERWVLHSNSQYVVFNCVINAHIRVMHTSWSMCPYGNAGRGCETSLSSHENGTKKECRCSQVVPLFPSHISHEDLERFVPPLARSSSPYPPNSCHQSPLLTAGAVKPRYKRHARNPRNTSLVCNVVNMANMGNPTKTLSFKRLS